MTISNDKVAMIRYTLHDDKGNLLDSNMEEEPMGYIHGTGTLLEGLEDALNGKKAGDKIKVVLSPENGYGEYDKELVEEYPRSAFEEGDPVEVGSEFQYEADDGEVVYCRITKVEGDTVTVDSNHPFVDKTLNYDLEIMSVRDATAEELDHGHVHGEGGHNH